MKKIFYLLLTCLFCISVLAGCKAHTALSADDFTDKMEDKDFDVETSTDYYFSVDDLDEALMALGDDYSVEYFSFDSEDAAKDFFDSISDTLKSDGASSTKSINTNNYAIYTIDIDGTYSTVSRVKDTVITVVADNDYKKEIKKLISSLGY